MSDMHEFEHPNGLRIRVPKLFFLGKKPPNEPLQLVRNDDCIQFPIAILEDISAYLKAVSWYEVDAMTPASPDWAAFMKLLRGKEGINLRTTWKNKEARAQGPFRYSCSCSNRPYDWEWDGESTRWPKATAILRKHFPHYDVQDTLAYWMLYKADCDCLIAFNVDGVLTAGFASMVNKLIEKKLITNELAQVIP